MGSLLPYGAMRLSFTNLNCQRSCYDLHGAGRGFDGGPNRDLGGGPHPFVNGRADYFHDDKVHRCFHLAYFG